MLKIYVFSNFVVKSQIKICDYLFYKKISLSELILLKKIKFFNKTEKSFSITEIESQPFENLKKKKNLN